MTLLRRFALLLCGAVALPLYAAETWYEVELIVVAQRTPDAGSEIWPLKALPPASQETALAIPAPEQPPASAQLTALPAENFRLTAEAQRIAADANYELLLHTGWRQPGLPREQAIPVRIHAVAAPASDTAEAEAVAAFELAESSPRLDGTVRLILARYLHLDTDLRYHQAEPPRESGFFSAFDTQPTEPPVYRLNESRRMRSREVHYLDHPMFGVIALVTPYEMPAAAPAPKPVAPPAAVPAAPATGATGSIRRN